MSAETETDICLIAYRTSTAIDTRLQGCLYSIRPRIRLSIIDIHIVTYRIIFTSSSKHIAFIANAPCNGTRTGYRHIRTAGNLCRVLLKRRASDNANESK